MAIKDGKIAAVGAGLVAAGLEAKEVYDATGMHVAPGWIDPHTHFDAQYSWDPFLLPCGPAGVTTAIMGNCGIGFAPCQADRRTFLSELMEAIEDIPTDVIQEGLEYDFETFEECKCSRSLCVFFRSLKEAAAQTWTRSTASRSRWISGS
eukprot:COSAG04_NODE_1369_length_7049_cov_3.114676_2_plen_150_part_00